MDFEECQFLIFDAFPQIGHITIFIDVEVLRMDI
jgi:hypothetical protein